MRVVCPAAAHALISRGRGGWFWSDAATTSKVTVLDARLPAESMTEYVTSMMPGLAPASRRTWLPVTKGFPSAFVGS